MNISKDLGKFFKDNFIEFHHSKELISSNGSDPMTCHIISLIYNQRSYIIQSFLGENEEINIDQEIRIHSNDRLSSFLSSDIYKQLMEIVRNPNE